MVNRATFREDEGRRGRGQNARTRDYATVSSRRERIIRCVSPTRDTLLLRILPLRMRRDPCKDCLIFRPLL